MLNSITFVYVCDLWCEHCTPCVPVCFVMDDSVVNWSGSLGDIINCIGPSYACNSRPLLIRMRGDIAPAVAVVEPDIGRSNCMSLACTMPGAARFCLIYVSMSWRYNAQKMKMNKTKFINLQMFDLGYQPGRSKLIFKVSLPSRMPLCYGALLSFCRKFICKVHRTCNRYSTQSLVERTETQNQQKTTNGSQFSFHFSCESIRGHTCVAMEKRRNKITFVAPSMNGRMQFNIARCMSVCVRSCI